MKKAYSKSSRQGLPGGPNEMFQKVKGIIVSERGQWDFPGMTTLVPTDDGRITMRGVPYPVLGQDETGYTQMMYPEQEYQFPGQNVLELPMAQNGLSTPIINLPEYTVIDEKIPENIRLANTAKRLVEELYDVSRPAAGFTEKISDFFIPGEKKYYDNTCVKGVCDIFKEANLNSGIPEDVLNNKDFLENYSKYGFTLVPNEQLQVGDIIQYYEKDRPTHLGIYVGDDEYVGDGSKDKPLVKSNIHKYPDGKDKLPFRAFRKNFKSGGSLPKAQNGPPTFNDSLELYKNTVALENFLRSKNATVPKDKFRRWQWEDSQPLVGTNPARNWYTLNPNLSDREKALSYANSLYNVDKSTGSKSLPKSHYIKTQNNLIGTRDWAPEGEDDKDFPVSYIHPQIKPQFEGDVDDMSGVAGSFYMYRYDPIAIKPGALLTPKELAIRLKKYGKRGIPQSKVDEYYASKKPVTTSAAPPVALPVTPKKEFVRNINQFPFKNPATGKTEDRVSLITPAHQYIMNLSQYSKLLPTDSIPQKGNFLYRTNYKKNGGALPKAQMLGQFNPQLFQPNPLTGRYNWEKPKAKPQLRDFEPKQKAAERSSTNVATKPDPIKAARQINATAAEEYERNRGVIRNAPVRASSYFKPGGYDPTPLAEYTGVPSMVRIAQNPESINDFLTGVDQLLIGSSPVSGMMGLRRDFTPEETQALLDYSTVATMGLPLVRGAGKLGAQGLRQTGKYLTQGPLRNAYNLRSSVLKENPEMFLYRARPVGQDINMNMAAQIRAKQAAGEPLTWYQKNLLNPQTNPQLLAREKYYGQWFEKDPNRLDWYIDPGTRNFADQDAIEILRTRLPKSEAAKLNVSQFDDAKMLSSSPETEFILPKDMVNTAERFPESSLQQLIAEDKAFNTPHWWRGYGSKTPKQLPGSSNVTPVINTARNLEDLKAAQQFAKQYGYELPANLERIAQSNELTDRTIRGIMDRHNTFVRGVSTNWEELGKRNPEILRHLEGKGFDLSTKEGTKAAAEYMATHIPINTGYGRASLNNEVFDRGMDGLYTSNSIPTAEGYTYGQGYITKVKRPTNYSSSNRQDWISQNNPYYRDEDEFRKLMYPLSDEANYAIHLSKQKSWTPKSFDEKSLKNATPKQKATKEIEYRIEQLKKDISELEPNKDKFIDASEVIYSKKETIKQLENDIKYLDQHGDELLQAPGEFKILRTERSDLPTDPFNFLIAKEGNTKKLTEWLKKQPYQEKMREIDELGESLTKYSWDEQQPIRAKIKDLKDEANVMYNQSVQDYMKVNHPDYDPVNKYAHYIHLGTPGEKILQPIKSWEITPEIWKNKSRRHSNKYSKKFSAMANGGILNMQRFGGNLKFQKGGDYNMQRALELGYTPDEAGHYPSVDEETGMWLKSKQHPTAWMESMYGYQLNPEVYNNYNVVYNPEGYFGENQLQYVPKQLGGSLPKAQVGKYIPSWLNPMNWGVEDYTDKYKTWGEAYAAAKKAGLKEIMWNKGPNPGRKNLDYAGTVEEEAKTYFPGYNIITGIEPTNYPALIAQEIENEIRNSLSKGSSFKIGYPHAFSANLDAKSTIDFPSLNLFSEFGRDAYDNTKYYASKVDNKNLDRFNAHSKIIQKGRYPIYDFKNNNCAGNVCYGLGLPVHDYQTPYEVPYLLKIKYPTVELTSNITNAKRKYEDLYEIWNLPNILKVDLEKLKSYKNNRNLVQEIQEQLYKEGYELPYSLKEDLSFDGVFGDETENALKDWQKKNSKKQFGGFLPTAGDPVLNFITQQQPRRFSKSKK